MDWWETKQTKNYICKDESCYVQFRRSDSIWWTGVCWFEIIVHVIVTPNLGNCCVFKTHANGEHSLFWDKNAIENDCFNKGNNKNTLKGDWASSASSFIFF